MSRPPKPHRGRTGAVPAAEKTTWTAERIRALGATTNVSTAAEIFGLSRDTAYHLARTGQFPVPVLRIGRQLRVPVAPILTLLGMPTDTPHPPGPATAAGPPDGTGPQPP